MAEYLLPNESILTISDKQLMFAIRKRLMNIHGNYPKKRNLETTCKAGCEVIETNEHIYWCKKLNENNIELKYKEICNGKLRNQEIIMSRMKNNLQKRSFIVSE